jgi:hypothetical protein
MNPNVKLPPVTPAHDGINTGNHVSLHFGAILQYQPVRLSGF